MLRTIISCIVFVIFVLRDQTKGDIFEECGVTDSMYISVPENCSFFIFCHGEESFKDSCPDDSPYFSPIDQTCDVDSTICDNRPSGATNAPVTPSPVEPSTTSLASGTSTTPISTSVTPGISSTNTLFTIPTVPVTSSNSPISTITLISSTTANPIITTSLKPITVTTAVPVVCPAVDDLNKAIFLPSSKSCSDYYLCYHGEPLPMYCSNMLHFNMKQQKCDYPENVNCQMDLVTPREQCSSHTFDVYPHPYNCNYYYLCSFGYLMVMQCPLKFGWDYEKRSCALLPQAKCYNTLQRFRI